MKMKKLLLIIMSVMLIALSFYGCGAAVPSAFGKEITIAELCKEYEDVYSKTPVSLTYTMNDGEPDTYSVEIDDDETAAEILRLLLETGVNSEGEHVDMYIMKFEEYCFDMGDEIYSFVIIPDSYFSYEGAYYELTESSMGRIRDMVEEFNVGNGQTEYIEPDEDVEPVSEWYSEYAVLETEFYDNGDEAPSYTELSLTCSEGTLVGGIEGAYDVLSIERQADCYIITYTYGDFYSHDEECQSRITVDGDELVIEELE